MDEIDIANEVAERYLAQHLRNARQTKALPTGICLNCDADLTDVPGRPKFCDADCRDDFERRQRAERRRGEPCKL